MTGRYRICMLPLLDNGVPRVWEPEKRRAQRWHLFKQACRSLAADGLDYSVSFSLLGDDPHILITASGKRTRKPKSFTGPTFRIVAPLKPQACAIYAREVEWFLPENRIRRNSNTDYWRRRRNRHDELAEMAEEQLRAELEYWRELELISGQREHFKPGLTDESLYVDDEVAA
jgi:hypothetical protein